MRLPRLLPLIVSACALLQPGCKAKPAPAAPQEAPHTAAEAIAAVGHAGEQFGLNQMGVALALGVTSGAAGAAPTGRTVGAVIPTPARQRRATGSRDAVATAHPLATQAALQTLDAGGNAVDALVAASFVLSVVTPQSTGIGGGGFAIVWPGGGKPAHALDFREQAPAAGLRAQYLNEKGHAVAKRSRRHGLAVGVPGYVAGLWALHKRWGRRPWASLVTPAVAIAERGFVMGDAVVAAADATWKVLHPHAKALIGLRGAAPTKGAVLRQPALGRTLRLIGIDGPMGFYAGAVAADVVATVQAAGGHLSLTDLSSYAPRWRKPLVGRALGLDVLTMPQPSAGGAQLVAMAELMDRFTGAGAQSGRNTGAKDAVRGRLRARKSQPVVAPGATHLRLDPTTQLSVAHALVETMRRAFQLRLAYSGDTLTPAAALDDVYPAAVRSKLASTFDPKRATPTPTGAGGKLEGHTNTSHVSIIDRDGMAVASTHTINLLFGSGIVAAKTGVWLNNELDDFSLTLTESNAFGLAGSKANLFRPGARPVSSMTPTIFLLAGKPALIIGSPGGTRIPTAVFQVAWRTLVAGQTLRAAVDAPRLHHQAFPDEVWVEAGVGEQRWRKGLRALGHRVVVKEPWCDVQAVRIRRGPAGQGRAAKAGGPAKNGGRAKPAGPDDSWQVEAVSDGRAGGSAGAR